MLQTVEDNFSLPEKYYKLKARLHNKKKLTYFERYLQYGNIDKKYTYEEATDIVGEVFKSLDKEFGEIVKDLLNKEDMMYFPRKEKEQEHSVQAT
jgi:oligoendopeptidase F